MPRLTTSLIFLPPLIEHGVQGAGGHAAHSHSGHPCGQRSMVSFAHLTQVHEIISDLEIDLDWTMILHQAGVRFSHARTASHLLGEGLQ